MRRPGGARLPWYPCGRPTPELAPASAALARRAQRPSSSHILCCAPPAPTTLPGRCRTAAAARQRTPCCSGRELRCPLSRPSNAAERVWSSQGRTRRTGLVGFGVHSSHQAHTERGSSLLRRAALSVWLLTRNGWIPFPLSGGWALLGLQLLRSTRNNERVRADKAKCVLISTRARQLCCAPRAFTPSM